jgi:hypothetical protein
VADRQAALGETIFVARILFLRDPEGVKTASVWTDAIPVVLPKTDLVILHRRLLAPRRWFRRRPEYMQVEWSELDPFLSSGDRRVEPMEHYTLRHDPAPPDLVDFFRTRPALTERPERLMSGDVLNAELVGNQAADNTPGEKPEGV